MSFDLLLRRFIRSEEPEFISAPRKDEVVGRTTADLLYDSRFYILIIVFVVVFGFTFVFSPGLGDLIAANMEIIEAFVGPLILCFILGLRLVPLFLRVPTMDFLVLDFEAKSGALHRIPVTVLSRMEISGGNDLAFSWRTGDTFRLARSVDLENGIIRTAWPHEVPIEQAAFTLEDMQKREDDYQKKTVENLLFRRRPIVIGADLARSANDYLVSEISELLKMKEFNIDDYIAKEDPLRNASSVPAEEDDLLAE